MRRRFAAALAALLLAGAASGCKPKMVEVQTGTQVLCTYGEVVSETIETVLVRQKEAGRYSVHTSTIVCERHRRAQELYDQAQAALAAGDLKAAREKLDEVARLDPAFRNVAGQRAAIGGTTTRPGSRPATVPAAVPSKPATQAAVGPVVNLLKYVPDALAGYSAQAVSPDVLSISRMYVPATSGDLAQLVIQAEQFKDAAQAEQRLGSGGKAAYPNKPSTVSVGGRAVYFGTNNRGYAAVVLNEGAALVVFEAYSSSGRPEGLKSALTAVAEAVM